MFLFDGITIFFHHQLNLMIFSKIIHIRFFFPGLFLCFHVELLLNNVYKLRIQVIFCRHTLCLSILYLYRCYLLNSYMLLLLMQQIISLFYHLIVLSLNQLVSFFFHSGNGLSNS